jgi:hypothetical protein
MPQIPFQLRYSLSRSQRLVPHLRIFGVAHALFVVVLFTFFAVQGVVSVGARSFLGIAVFGGLALAMYLLHLGLFVGLLDVLLVRVRSMDVIIADNAAGIMVDSERWYLFLDGIKDMRKYRRDTWTIQHCNGTVLHIAASALSEEQIEYIRNAMERGRTPQGVQAVIERGKRIEAIMRGEREA